MHIILTHEQADFDALASLLGAYLLTKAVPVLPRRMNRNLRAFLALYGVDLPFVDPRDLPNETIEAVTLVDTQSMISVKGMGPETKVQVIDHHPLREDLPDRWSVNIVELGATTTLLVDALRERGIVIIPLYATLLLLGIYEDTGSLTYTRTTVRDLRAAAYLLEQGASLQNANDFLNHPLSQAQQALYDELRTTVRHYHIHGHTIIIGCCDALDMDEELSTIAHKLRDLLDPDALFLLVTTRGGVQMIARSTSDNIDVAEVVSRFGGGGHKRAAAGLIRNRELEDICDELVNILPKYVRPAITVAQIMSRDPQLLAANTPVGEAARRMQRYGYEGYPVIKDGKLVGLLTRRAVDRALAHELNLTAESLMEAGEFTVYPTDSVEHLQRLVTETGWGQIPTVDRQTGEIIGIVTRTDLLKTLSPPSAMPSRHNLVERLEAALPAERLALLKTIAEAAFSQRAALYIVGGFVRDLLLERPSLDFDLVVEGDAIALARALSRRYGGRVTSHTRFGTAKWHLDKELPVIGEPDGVDSTGRSFFPPLQSIDLVTARTEFYDHPSALPTVEHGSIKLDLHRRDFTINTLALRLDGPHYGELHDDWGGLNDLRHSLVRVLHSLSFVDDPTRILRAVRFEQRFSFHIEDRTMQLLQEARPLIDRLSGDRIRHELDHILAETFVTQIMARLHELNLLSPIHPSLIWDEWLRVHIETLGATEPGAEWELPSGSRQNLTRNLIYTLWMIRLEPKQARQVSKSLKMPAVLARTILAACELWRDQDTLVKAAPSRAVVLLDEVPPLARYALYLATDDIRVRSVLQDYVLEWQKIVPQTTGHDLKDYGLPPGPAYRDILATLRAAWLDGKISSLDEEKTLLEEILRAT